LRVTEVWFALGIHPFKWSFIKPVMAGFLGTAIIALLRHCVHSNALIVDFLCAVSFVLSFITAVVIMKLDKEDMVVIMAIKRKFSGRPFLATERE
jgi:hypothetical protein